MAAGHRPGGDRPEAGCSILSSRYQYDERMGNLIHPAAPLDFGRVLTSFLGNGGAKGTAMYQGNCLGVFVNDLHRMVPETITYLPDRVNAEHDRALASAVVDGALKCATDPMRPHAAEVCVDGVGTVAVYEPFGKGYRSLVPNEDGILVEGSITPAILRWLRA